MKRTSLKDIALKVGVSTAAVSLVLNGKEKEGRVSKEMAEKIRQAAHELNYQPNRLAKGLQSGRTQTVGLVVADISNPFFATLAFHIQEELEKSGYAVIIMNTNEDDMRMGQMINLLRERQVDGFIIVPTQSGESSIRSLVEQRVPLVLIDRYYPSVPAPSVVIDNYEAARAITRYLVQASCKRIGLLLYANTQPHMQERKRGFSEALCEAGIFDPRLIREVCYNSLPGDVRRAVYSLVKEEGVDGLLFATNTIAVIGVKYMVDLKVKLPEEVHIATFDKSEAFDFMPFPVPYIRQPIADMGRKAVDLLLLQMENEVSPAISVSELPACLVTGRTD